MLEIEKPVGMHKAVFKSHDWFLFSDWLRKWREILADNKAWLKISRQFLNQSEVKHKPIVTYLHDFPALSTGYMYLLRVLIGSLDCVRLL